MAELLLEILSEEIPARMQARAAEDLRRLMGDGLKAAGLACETARSYVTPRRLTVVVEGLPARQPDVSEEKKGPKVGAPDQALQGFMKANGLASIDEAEIRESAKGRFYFAVRQIAGKPTAEVLPEVILEAMAKLPWPKSMRWTAGNFRWVRPIHGLLAVFDGAPLAGSLDLGGDTAIDFGATTRGHRFLANSELSINNLHDYIEKLHEARVILDRDERKAIIAERAGALAAAEGLTVKDDPGLIDEVAGLVEWPEVLPGRIDAAYMDLPPEVLVSAMRGHQKYLSTVDSDGRLADRFLVVANMPVPEGSVLRETITAGNERVLRARLADARFFWDQDRRRSLASWAPDLAKVVFHAKLGSLDDKADRMQALGAELAHHIPGADIDRVRSAARLAKADLTSGMVAEFPELQGVMGRYYGLADGENQAVAEAIAEHYGPLGPGDRCPSAPVSVAVALADKLDTLVGFWMIGETPTGSKDPYALRRAALGVIRLVVENKLRLPLGPVIKVAASLYGKAAATPVEKTLLAFFAERLKVALKDEGVRHDLITAVFALGGEDDLVRLLARVKALEAFLASEDGANLLTAYRRAANIVRIEAKKDGAHVDGAADQGRFVQPQETALSDALAAAVATVEPALAAEDYGAAMGAMSRLRRPVDAFFDEVTVNAEDRELRANRLRLLSGIGGTLGRVADFSRIEG